MKTLNYKDIVQLYKEKFGEEPLITGGSFWQSDKIIDRLIDAINTGVKFEDVKVPDGALV